MARNPDAKRKPAARPGTQRSAPRHQGAQGDAAFKGQGLQKPRRDSLLIWGRNPALTALEKRPQLCRQIYLARGVQPAFRQQVLDLSGPSIGLTETDRAELDRLTEQENHQGIAVILDRLPPVELDQLLDQVPASVPSLVVLMDHCQDPHNLGAVIRSAEVAGACCLVYQKDRSAAISGAVIKASAGAALCLPLVQAVNLNRVLEDLKARGYWAVGLDHRSDRTLWDSPLPERMALVVGSEGSGIGALTAKKCDFLVKLPMAGKTESLNASVAASLGIFEWVRLWGPSAERR